MLSASSNISKSSPDRDGEEDSDGARFPVVSAGEPDLDGLSESEKAAIDDIVLHAKEEYTEEQYRRVLRKQDFILLPLMWLCVSCWPRPSDSAEMSQTDTLPRVRSLVTVW